MRFGRKSGSPADDDFEFITDSQANVVAPTLSPGTPADSSQFLPEAPNQMGDAHPNTPVRKLAIALLAIAKLLTTTSAAWFAINRFAGKQQETMYIAGWLPDGFRPLYRDGPFDKAVAPPKRSRRVMLFHPKELKYFGVDVITAERQAQEPTRTANTGKEFAVDGLTWKVTFEAPEGYFNLGAKLPSGAVVEAFGSVRIAATKKLLRSLRISDESVPQFDKIPPGWEVSKAWDDPSPRSVIYQKGKDTESFFGTQFQISTIESKGQSFAGEYGKNSEKPRIAGRRTNLFDINEQSGYLQMDFGKHVVGVYGVPGGKKPLIRVAESVRPMSEGDQRDIPERNYVAIGDQQIGGTLAKSGTLSDGNKWRVVRTDLYSRRMFPANGFSNANEFAIGLVGVPGAVAYAGSTNTGGTLPALLTGLDLSAISMRAALKPTQVSVTHNGVTTVAHFIPQPVGDRMYAFIPLELANNDRIEINTLRFDPHDSRKVFTDRIATTFQSEDFARFYE